MVGLIINIKMVKWHFKKKKKTCATSCFINHSKQAKIESINDDDTNNTHEEKPTLNEMKNKWMQNKAESFQKNDMYF